MIQLTKFDIRSQKQEEKFVIRKKYYKKRVNYLSISSISHNNKICLSHLLCISLISHTRDTYITNIQTLSRKQYHLIDITNQLDTNLLT